MCLAHFQSRQLLRKAFSQAVPAHYCKRKLSASALISPTSCQGDCSWHRDRQTEAAATAELCVCTECTECRHTDQWESLSTFCPTVPEISLSISQKEGVGEAICLFSNHLHLHTTQNLFSGRHLRTSLFEQTRIFTTLFVKLQFDIRALLLTDTKPLLN